jgi:hypothetical protein
MTTPEKPKSTPRNDPKTLLTALKMTTTIGAVGLTLAGWGILSRAEVVTAAQPAQNSTAELAGATIGTNNALVESVTGISPESVAAAKRPRATATATAAAKSATLPTPTPQPTSAPTATAEAVATPVVKFKLDIVQWVTTQAGDPVAVVRDNSGVLWYVWGDDVPRIEQGLDPEYQPQAVNSAARSRGS